MLGALSALIVLAAPGCGDEAAVSRLVLRPGDGLLAHLDRARVVAVPASTWPTDVAAVLAREDRALQLRLPSDEWRDSGEVPEVLGLIAGLDGSQRLWRARRARDLSLSFAGAEVTVEGRPCEPILETPGGALPDDLLAWSLGSDGGVLFADTRRDELMVIGPETPGDVVVRFAADPLPQARRWEPEPLRIGDDATGLGRRAELGRVSRRALLLPAHGVVEFPLGSLRADALRVAVGLPAHGFVVEAGGLLPDPQAGDGVVCAVDLLEAGGSVRRLWSQALRPGQGWVEAEVSLDGITPDGDGDETWALRLVTEPGVGGDAAFDQALFADLTLVGEVTSPDPRPHVVLLDLDTLRADRLGCYGAARDTSPRLDAWAAEHAVLFGDCTASSSWTLPSTATLLTGLLPHQHGVDRPALRLSSTHEPLAQRLSAAGYETWAVAEGGYVSASFGFDLGFDRFETLRSQQPDWEVVLEQLASRRSERPLFLMLHTYLAHAPYDADPRWVAPDYAGPLAGGEVDADIVFVPHRLGQLTLDEADGAYVSALYDAGITRLDALVGAFLEGLEQALPPERTLVIVTSDHGEELLDHGGLDHGLTLYDEVLRVPLLVRFPDGRPGPARVEAPVSLADVVPTVLDVVGLPAEAELPGISLRGALPERRVRLAELSGDIRSIHYDGLKLLEGAGPGEARLFQLRVDPRELVDRAGELADQVAALRDRRQQLVSEHAAAVHDSEAAAVDDATREALEQLGYAGDG